MANGASSLLVRLGACVLPIAGLAGQQAAGSLVGLLPDDVVMAVDVAAPATAVQRLLAAAGDVPAGVPAVVLAPVGVGLTAVSVAIGGDPVAWARDMFGGGLAIGVQAAPPHPRALLVARPGDAAAARAWCERHAAGKFELAGELLWISGDAGALAGIARRADAPPGRWAAADLGPPRAIRGAIDLAAIRRLPNANVPSFDGLGGAARFFGAPAVHVLAQASWLRFGLGVSSGDRRAGTGALCFSAEADASVRGTPFGALLPDAPGRTLPPLPSSGLLSLCFDRSLKTLLAEPARFLLPADVLAVQGFLSIADAVDGARSSFVADLLGGLQEPFVLHVVPAAPPEGDTPASPIVLPGFALVAKLAGGETERILTRTAQALMTIANVERMQRGKPPFNVRAQRSERGHGLVAEPAPWNGPGLPPFDSELVPTLWFQDGFVAIATTRAAAEAVLEAPAAKLPRGDRIVLRGPAVAAAIEQNRGVLELARVLDEGEDRDRARLVVDTVVAVSAAIRELSITVDADATTTRLCIELERVR